MPAILKSAGKPKPPLYPRPVPEIPVQGLAHRPEDDRYYTGQIKSYGVGVGFGDEDDMEADATKRAAKRQRIEANAHAYLRGEQLGIMTARLRGPFGADWKNPWARPRRQRQLMNVVHFVPTEIPETTKKTTQSDRSEEQAREQEQARSSPGKDNGASHEQGKDKRVEDWLRTNELYMKQPSEEASQSSPTPGVGVKAQIQVPRSFGLLGESTKDREAIDKQARVRQLTRELDAIVSETVVKPALMEEKMNTKTLPDKHNSSRAEFAIFNYTKRSLPQRSEAEKLSPVVLARISDQNFQTSLPLDDRILPEADKEILSEVGRHDSPKPNTATGAVEPTKEIEHPTPLDTDNTVLGAGLAGFSQPDLNIATDPVPSMATSDLITVEMLPSAQPPPRLQPTMSSGPFEVQMIHVEDEPLADKAVGDLQEPRDQDLISLDHSGNGASACTMEQAAMASVNVLNEDASLKEANTGLASVSYNIPSAIPQSIPQPAALDDVGTYDEPNYGMPKQDSLPTIKASKLTRKRKRASFVAGLHSPKTMQSSLKNALKAKVGKSFGSPPLCTVGHPKFDSENLDEENMMTNKVIRLSTVGGSQNTSHRSTKGILKNTNTTNSQKTNTPTRTKHSSSHQQDGQGDKMSMCAIDQSGTTNDDAFDLEAAIGDLGSFLGSWDAEKEASGLVE